MLFLNNIKGGILKSYLDRYSGATVLQITIALRNPLHNQASSWCRNQEFRACCVKQLLTNQGNYI